MSRPAKPYLGEDLQAAIQEVLEAYAPEPGTRIFHIKCGCGREYEIMHGDDLGTVGVLCTQGAKP